MGNNKWFKTRPKYMDNLVHDKSNILNQGKRMEYVLNGTILLQIIINSKR